MANGSIFRIYFNRRMSALLGLGFASGLPYLLTLDSLTAWMAKAKVDISTIGIFSLVTLPYSLKFIWAPWMDRYAPPFLGRRRGWLALTQLALAVGIGVMAWAGPGNLKIMAIAALGVAFFSASQDIVADAYRTDVLHKKELGAGAAIFVLGYRLALITSGAGVLILADYIGWQMSFTVMAALLAGCIFISFLAPCTDTKVQANESIVNTVTQSFKTLAYGSSLWQLAALVAFILLFRLPDTLAGRMTMPFLLSQMHYAASDVGFIRQFIGLWVTILGTLAGGLVVARVGIRRSLWLFGILQALSNAGFLMLANMRQYPALLDDQGVLQLSLTSAPYMALAAVVVIESFCGGLVVAGFMAFLMSRCDKRYSATQYALLTSLMALTGSVLAAWTGYIVQAVGYSTFFWLTIAAGIPGMALIPFLGNADNDTAAATAPAEESDQAATAG